MTTLPRGRNSGADAIPPSLPAGIWRNPVCVLALGLGAGAVPYLPGTIGTLVAIPVYLLIAPLGPLEYAAVVALLFVAGIGICGRAGRVLGMNDHPRIVWDEIVGYLVTMFLAPKGWTWIVAGFALFRLFDIWKPFPIASMERRMRGGLGTMADDLLAGLYAWLCLQALVYWGLR